MSDTRNVIIIGSGPSGYTAAVYAARASLQPLVFEGSVTAGGALMNTTEVENFPGFRDGIMGPALMDEMRAQAERFGAEMISDDVVEVDLTGDVKVVKTATDTYTARAVILATGSGYRKLGPAQRGRAVRPRRLVVRDLRRLLLPRPAHRGRRRRRLRARGGHLPDPLRLQGLADRAPRRAARLQDHAGAGLRRPQARHRVELRGRLDQRRRQPGVGDPARHRHRRDPPARRDRPVHRHRPRPALRAARGPGRPRRQRLRAGRAPLDRHQPARRVRRRRPGRPPLPPGDHRRRHRLRGRARRRALPRRARPRRGRRGAAGAGARGQPAPRRL